MGIILHDRSNELKFEDVVAKYPEIPRLIILKIDVSILDVTQLALLRVS